MKRMLIVSDKLQENLSLYSLLPYPISGSDEAVSLWSEMQDRLWYVFKVSVAEFQYRSLSEVLSHIEECVNEINHRRHTDGSRHIRTLFHVTGEGRIAYLLLADYAFQSPQYMNVYIKEESECFKAYFDEEGTMKAHTR